MRTALSHSPVWICRRVIKPRMKSRGWGISKWGSKTLMTALWKSTLAAVPYNPACTALYERHIPKENHGKAKRVAVARKLLIQACSVM